MFDETMRKAIAEVAAETGIPAAALAAVADVESGLRVQAVVNGRPEPLIRFEGHYFDARLSGKSRAEARRLGLADPKAGAVANPASQVGRWKLLRQAASIDHKAAYESVSWGIGQVMGAHWAWLGYPDVDGLVAEARSGASGQLRLMARYIVKAGLIAPLSEQRWTTFARGYNGPGYRRNAYDEKLASAYARYAEVFEQSPATPRTLSAGASGDDVRALQQRLNSVGFDIVVDGLFGRETRRMVAEFQSGKGLPSNGNFDAITRRALEVDAASPPGKAEQPPSRAGGLLDRLFRFLI